MYVGRLAPSPTGYLHLGNARTFLVTWLRARQAGGTLIMRMEDLNYPRVQQETVRESYEDLRWLGLDWDYGPPDSQPLKSVAPHGSYVQSERSDVYRRYLDKLAAQDLVYPCTCTRKDILAALDAPHDGEEPRYPNTCRGRWNSRAEAQAQSGRNAALRMRVEPGESTFVDLFHGPHTVDLYESSGDFVVSTRLDQLPSYHLAVVSDDIEMGVTEVVRGADLLPTTHRHLLLYRAFGMAPPNYYHLPLMRDTAGRRLAKRDGDTRIAHLRKQGIPAERVLGWLAYTLGQQSTPSDLTVESLQAQFDPTRIPRNEIHLTTADRTHLGLAERQD